MTECPPPDELLLLTNGVLQMFSWGRGEDLDFDRFLRDWQAVRMAQDGGRHLSLWTGPEETRIAVLCETAPEWRRLTAANYSPDELDGRSRPLHGSFRRPGRPLFPGDDCFCKHGLYLGWWPASGDEARLRLTRDGDSVTLAAGPEGFVLLDWGSSAAVESFDAIGDAGEDWRPCIVPFAPCDAQQLYQAYRRHDEWCRLRDHAMRGRLKDRNSPDSWAYDLIGESRGDFADVVVGLLHHADPTEDAAMLMAFGAHIYGNDAAFFQRLEAEMDAGHLGPEVVGRVLVAERPEFLEGADRAAFDRLYGRSGRAV